MTDYRVLTFEFTIVEGLRHVLFQLCYFDFFGIKFCVLWSYIFQRSLFIWGARFNWKKDKLQEVLFNYGSSSVLRQVRWHMLVFKEL
jgi:hypothetical protein